MDRKSRSVVVIFSDSGLGGTSRSALTSCECWIALGYNPIIHATKGITPSRRAVFQSKGQILENLTDLDWAEVSVVHFHYSSYSAGQHAAIQLLQQTVRSLGSHAPHLIVNNIFAIQDSTFARWPGKWCTAVLGEWAAMQYRLSGFPSNKAPFVIGNCQDTDTFRPPTAEEREESRNSLNIAACDNVILRVGSPHDGKWSSSYLKLAQMIKGTSTKMILIGAPESISLKLEGNENCHLIARVDDDHKLRRYYWASDCFALDAERGESFGNVILESLGSGLPVVYRAREYRDNTPWEFTSIKGFSYQRNESAFLSKAICKASVRESPTCTRARDTHRIVVSRFSTEATAAKLEALVQILDSASTDGKVCSTSNSTIPKLSYAKSFLRHNPLIAYLKKVRLEVRG
ncbi:hypothetical protein C7E19_05065 [Stenotrophomonas maltophilia]|nr:hypothetical protein C7E19_05065 [Stenotrophomonas maltophilia]